MGTVYGMDDMKDLFKELKNIDRELYWNFIDDLYGELDTELCGRLREELFLELGWMLADELTIEHERYS